MRTRILQKIANHIVHKVETAKSKDSMEYWLEIGMAFNKWCVNRNIYLN